MTIAYRDTEPGVYRALRLWQDADGRFVIDCERTDGSLGAQEWEYPTMGAALRDFPVLYAVQVLGVRVVMQTNEPNPAQASAPSTWRVYFPIEDGGERAEHFPTKQSAESRIRIWLQAEQA